MADQFTPFLGRKNKPSCKTQALPVDAENGTAITDKSEPRQSNAQN